MACLRLCGLDDAAIAAIKSANSADPAKYLPALQKVEFVGATGKIAFDEKGDRKDAEMTIFVMKAGRIEPLAIIKSGRTIKYEDFARPATPAPRRPTG